MLKNIQGDFIRAFSEGKSYDSYKYLGCQEFENENKKTFCFRVWAPNAKEVYLVGSFNDWNKKINPMKLIENTGIWEIYLDNIKYFDTYKYRIIGLDNKEVLKSDPYAIYSELRPNTASIVYPKIDFNWNDDYYLSNRDGLRGPINIYEVHLGSYKRKWNGDFFNFKELYELIDYVCYMGYTHIELMPITEHPLDESWGYQTTGYYSVTSRYGNIEEFKLFINRCHEKGIGVILDFAYSHFCKDEHGLYRFDGSPLFEYKDPLKAENVGWGTAHFDLGKGEVKSFLLSNVLYWFNEFHIDGIRVDAVSSMLYLDYDISDWTPNKYGGRENLEAIDFLRNLNEVVYKYVKNPMVIAEESTSWPNVTGPTYKGALGFTYKWNMGWMNDTLKYMEMDPIYRKYHHNLITFSFMYAFSENFILPLSHDEVVHGKKSLLDKMSGDSWQMFSSLRTLYSYYMIHPGKKLLFMGCEFGQGLEWRYSYGLEWELLAIEQHAKMKDFVKDLNNLYKENRAFWELDNTYEGFDFIDPNNSEQSIITLMRKGMDEKDFVIAVINFTPVVYYDYKIGVPFEGDYIEILNSDDTRYYGSGQTMKDIVLTSFKGKWHNKENYIKIKVPPMGATFITKKDKISIKYEEYNDLD